MPLDLGPELTLQALPVFLYSELLCLLMIDCYFFLCPPTESFVSQPADVPSTPRARRYPSAAS